MKGLFGLAAFLATCCGVNAVSANVELAIYIVDDLADAVYNKWGWTDAADKEDRLKSFFLAQYDTGLKSVYGDSSLTDRGININVAIVEIRIVADKDIESFSEIWDLCSWQKDLTGGRDAAIFVGLWDGPFHKRIGFSAGRAMTDTACDEEYHCGVVAENPNLAAANSRLIAHELGHVLGLIDQGSLLEWKLKRRPDLRGEGAYADERCANSDTKSVMAGNGYTWCVCSQDAFIKNLPNYACLANEPDVKLTADLSKLPGVEHTDRREQCVVFKKETTDPPNYSIEYTEKDVSGSPCKFVSGECIKKEPTPEYPWRWRDFGGAQLLAGTPCGNGKICLNGECIQGEEGSDNGDGEGDKNGNGEGGENGNGDGGEKAVCPTGFKEFQGECYASFDNGRKISKANAQEACQEKGANLASISSQAVNDFLVSTFNTKQRSAWIGLDRVKWKWQWTDGTPLTWTGFAFKRHRKNSKCAFLGNSKFPDKWISVNCNKTLRRYYICSLKLNKK